MEINYQAIGVIRSSFTRLEQMPIQPSGTSSGPGSAEIFPQFAAGLKDLEGFSHLILIYHLHQVARAELVVTPFLDSEERGVFATRAPTRPNPIGVSIVRLTGIDGRTLHLANIDILDGTPLVDIKPYIPAFDAPKDVRIGWLQDVVDDVRSRRSDDRFI